MVVDTRGVETDGWVFEPGVVEFVGDALHDVADGVFAVIVGQGVGFVDEDGVFDVVVDVGFVEGVDFGELEDDVAEPGDGFHVVVLGVDDPDDACDAVEDGLGVEGAVEVVDLAGEVPDLEVHE